MKDYITVPEDLIKITKYEVIDKLPNPFVFNDGTTVKTKEDWEQRRKKSLTALFNCSTALCPLSPNF